MAFEPNYDSDTSTGDKPSVFATITVSKTNALVTHHIGSSQPAGFADGWIWIDDTSATRLVLKFGQNSGVAILIGYSGGKHICEADLDFDLNFAVNIRIEPKTTGNLTAAASANEGQLEWDSTLERLVLIGSTQRHYVAEARTDGTTYARIPMKMVSSVDGTVPVEDGDTEWGGYTLDLAAEELALVSRLPIPNGWTGANDITLEITFLLKNAETAGDDARFDGVWHTLTPGSGDGTGLAEEGFAQVDQDIGSANAQYDIHTVALTIDHDAVGNVVAIGDYIKATINHDIAGPGTPVAGVIVVAACLKVPIFNYDS